VATSASNLVLQGKYQLFRKLADAGHIEVYVGATRSPRRAVVVKRVPPSLAKNKPTVGSFLDEARTTARLQHAAIAQVLDVGEDGGTYVAVFEHVFGVDAQRLIDQEKNKLPIPIALRLVVTMLEALEYAHSAAGDDGSPLQLVHRDVSARNLLVGYDGVVKLTGFGLAKHQERSEHTSFGVVRGQLAYVSPEQLRVGELDARTDVWSTGVLLYQLLTGALPFDRQGEFHVLKAIRDEDPKPPSELRAELPAALDAVVAKALAKDREQRFASAAEMRAAIENIGLLAKPEDVAEHVSQLYASALGSHLADAVAGEASLTAVLALAGGEVLGEPEVEAPKPAKPSASKEQPRASKEQPASTERTSMPSTESTNLPRPPPRPAPIPTERSQQETAYAPSLLDPSTDSQRTPLPDPDPRPSDHGFRPERAPLLPEHTPEPPAPAVRHMPEAPRASVPRPEPKPEPKRAELPEKRGSKKRRVRFKLVTERGLNPIVYPLAVLVALMLGLAAGRAPGPTEVALEPLPPGGPPMAALDAPVAPLAPHPIAPTPLAPVAPPQQHTDDELQLTAQTPHGAGTLRVDAPRTARVFIDKKPHGQGSLSVSLPAGTHDLKVVLQSGAVKEESVHVEPGKTVRRSLGGSGGKVVPQQPKSSNWP